MSDDETVTIEIKGLQQLLKALKKKLPIARVGILADKNSRAGGSTATNAAIGAAHEFGTDKMPQRSFLRVPIAEHLAKKMEDSGALDESTLKEVIKSGSAVTWVKKIAVIAEGIVAEAFATGGFGKWPGWKNPNYKNKDNRLLVDTGQLRDSITSEVKE